MKYNQKSKTHETIKQQQQSLWRTKRRTRWREKEKKIPDERINKTSSLRGCCWEEQWAGDFIVSTIKPSTTRTVAWKEAREGGNETMVAPRVENNGSVSAFLRSGKFIRGWSNNWYPKGSTLLIKAPRQQWESDTCPRILEIVTSVRSLSLFLVIALILSYLIFSLVQYFFFLQATRIDLE